MCNPTSNCIKIITRAVYISVMGISITLHMGMIATCFCVTWNVYGAYDVSNV